MGKAVKEESKISDATTVEFSNFNQLKKKSVRGLLRKRAKKYDCK